MTFIEGAICTRSDTGSYENIVRWFCKQTLYFNGLIARRGPVVPHTNVTNMTRCRDGAFERHSSSKSSQYLNKVRRSIFWTMGQQFMQHSSTSHASFLWLQRSHLLSFHMHEPAQCRYLAAIQREPCRNGEDTRRHEVGMRDCWAKAYSSRPYWLNNRFRLIGPTRRFSGFAMPPCLVFCVLRC